QRRDPADEVLHLRPGALERARLGDALGGFGGEHEAGRSLLAPAGVHRRRLRAVIGAVDLDRRQLAAGVLEFAPLHEALRVEAPAPGREHPAADADADAVHRRYAGVRRGEGQAVHRSGFPNRRRWPCARIRMAMAPLRSGGQDATRVARGGLAAGAALLPPLAYGRAIAAERLLERIDGAIKRRLADAALQAATDAGASYCDIRIGRYLRQSLLTREARVENVANEESV